MSRPERFEALVLGRGQAGLPYPKLRDAVIAHLTMAEGLGPLLASTASTA